MLKIAMICLLVAVVILAVGVCLMRKNNYLSILLKTLTIIALVVLGFVVANYKDDFSGFSILVILSVLPMILSAFDLKQLTESKKGTSKVQESEIDNETTENLEITESVPAPAPAKKNASLAESNGNLFFAIGSFLTAVCISVATLYVGKETYLGALIGLLIGGGATFAFLAIKKIKNPFDIISYLLIFISIGLMAGNILLTLLYSISKTNLLFCGGCLLFAIYCALHLKWNKNFLSPVYYLSVILLLLSILL